MEAMERASLILTLIRELRAVLEREVLLLQGMNFEGLEELQEEKAALADAYEVEVAALRRTPEFVAALDPAVREALLEAMRELRRVMRQNLEALMAARTVTERVARHIAASLETSRHHLGSREPAEGAAQVVPLTLNRQV